MWIATTSSFEGEKIIVNTEYMRIATKDDSNPNHTRLLIEGTSSAYKVAMTYDKFKELVGTVDPNP